MPDVAYSPQAGNWPPYRSLVMSTEINFLPKAKVKQQIARRIKSGERLFVVLDWRGFMTDVEQANKSSTSPRTERSRHAIVVSRSKLGNGFVRIQNSYGTKFGDDGFIDVSIDILIKHIEYFDSVSSRESQ